MFNKNPFFGLLLLSVSIIISSIPLQSKEKQTPKYPQRAVAQSEPTKDQAPNVDDNPPDESEDANNPYNNKTVDPDLPQIEELQKAGVQGQKRVKIPRQNKAVIALGGTYFDFKQEHSSYTEPLAFSSFELPSIFAQFEKNLSFNFDIMASYKSAPGKIQDGSNVSLLKHDYRWDTMALDIQYTRSGWIRALKNRLIEFSLLGGVAIDTYPILTVSGLSAASFEYVKLTTLNLGVHFSHQLTKRWYYEFFIRYDYLLSTSNIEVENEFIFDGSAGIIYALKKKLDLGWFWYGKYQTNNYTHYEKELSANAIGRESLFYSTMDLRLIYKF